LQLHSFALKQFFFENLALLVFIVVAQCALNSSKAQLHFAYCALVLQIAFCFCSTTFEGCAPNYAKMSTEYQTVSRILKIQLMQPVRMEKIQN
jgi:hypothetical protein